MNGAPFQVFMSADTSFPQKLVDAGRTEGPVKVYAVGALIFLTTKKLDLSKGLAVLADPSVAQFANCNPETAPYGRAARRPSKKAGLFEQVKSKLVVAQTVTQALQFTLTSTDAGFVNKSALYSKEVKPYDKEGEYWFAVDPSLYSPISPGLRRDEGERLESGESRPSRVPLLARGPGRLRRLRLRSALSFDPVPFWVSFLLGLWVTGLLLVACFPLAWIFARSQGALGALDRIGDHPAPRAVAHRARASTSSSSSRPGDRWGASSSGHSTSAWPSASPAS